MQRISDFSSNHHRIISPGARCGAIQAPASKSFAHRIFIAAALSQQPCCVVCPELSEDLKTTLACLRAFGAKVRFEDKGRIQFSPFLSALDTNTSVDFQCGVSGSTLRFLLPVATALGLSGNCRFEGIPRPMTPLIQALRTHGADISSDDHLFRLSGTLQPGDYTIPGDISSQFVSGLLFALPLLDGDSQLTVIGHWESRPYIAMTEAVLRQSGIRFEKHDQVYGLPGHQHYHCPQEITVEGDWSGAAFFLCMGALSSNGIAVQGLVPDSLQGDRQILEILKKFGAKISMTENEIRCCRGQLRGQTINAADVPDLVPTLAALAAFCEGDTQFVHAGRLRYKESDRLETTTAMIRALGGDAIVRDDVLIIRGNAILPGGVVDAAGDHRIAMAAAVAATGCAGKVTVIGSDCVRKSYPGFWRDFEHLEVQNCE